MRTAVVISALACSAVVGATRPLTAAPLVAGTIFMDPDIIVASDPTAFQGLVYAGIGQRLMFDRRANAFVSYDAFLFDAAFAGGLTAEIQVNPEFGSQAAAQAEALAYARAIGQLPVALRADVETVWIHQGVEPFGGGNRNILIHTGQAALYAGAGVLEETLVHEAAHTSLDPAHAASPGWMAAQGADGTFISDYARDFPDREDVAETFLAWFAVRHASDRIPPALVDAITATIPHRLTYFDQQAFDMFPVASVPEPGALLLFSTAAVGALARRRRGPTGV